MLKNLPAITRRSFFSFIILFLHFLLSDCNKPLSIVEQGVTDSVSVALPHKKVLIIAIQGAKGSVMKSADIPHIKSLLSNSIYSWDAVCDTVSSDQAGWANLFTGVRSAKNGIFDGSYQANNFADYPSFLTRLKRGKNDIRIISIGDSPSLNDTLITQDATDATISLNDDETVKDSSVNRLQHDDPDVMVVAFSGVNKVGINHGFSTASTAYENALQSVDNYVGQILSALKSRQNFASEDWMIILTSNHGGKANGAYGGNNQDERNSFVINFNGRFLQEEIKMPLVNVLYSGKFPFFYRENGVDHAAYTNDAAYHFGADQDFTISFNILANKSSARRDNPIITNKDWNSGNNIGWLIYMDNGNIRINYRATDASRIDMRNGPVVDDGKWHHITVTFDRQKNISIYMDGKFYVSGPSIKDNGNIDSGLPLVVGTHGTLDFNYYGYNTGSLDAYVAGVRIWNTVLSPQVINEWAFIPVTSDHPDYSSLIGYWKMIDGKDADQKIKSSILAKPDLIINNGLKWNEVDGVLNPSAIDATEFVPHSEDVAINVMAWMGLKILPEWKLDGKLWILQ